MPGSHETTGAAPIASDGLATLLRLATRLLSVSAAAVLVLTPSGAQVVARHGLRPEEDGALLALVDEAALRSSEAEERLSSAGLRLVARTPINGSDLPHQGFLIALARGGEAAPGEPDSTALGDLAALAGPHLAQVLAQEPRKAGNGSGVSTLLTDAIDALPEAIAIFDEAGRFRYWNRRFEAVYAHEGVALSAGMPFEEHLRASVATGHVRDANGREEEWIAERMRRFRAGAGTQEHQLSNKRWIRVQDRHLRHGGTIGIRTEITDLVNREHSFRLLFDANPAPMFIIDRHTLAMLAVNDAALAFYGYDREAFLRLSLPDIRPEVQVGDIKAMMARLEDPRWSEQLRLHRTADGSERIVKVQARLLEHEGHEALLAAMTDMTEQQNMQRELQGARAFLSQVVDHVPASVFVKDMWNQGKYVLYNQTGETLVGRKRCDILGHTDLEVFGPDLGARFIEEDLETLKTGKLLGLEDEEFLQPDGTSRWLNTRKVALPDGTDNGYRYILGISEDVTQVRAEEKRIVHRAYHDALTDLPNRLMFRERLDAALAGLDGGEGALGVFLIDLDGFKAVNDTCGHWVGDGLLQETAARLRAVLRPTDMAARLGGDEFAVLQTPLDQPGEAAWLAGRLIASLARPYTVDGKTLDVTASIGIALTGTAADPVTLLRRADEALYRAKREGRNQYSFAEEAKAPKDDAERKRRSHRH